jgi:hypothetical protein
MKRVYVAGPMSHGDEAVNIRTAVLAGVEIIKAGHAPFIPHLFHFAHFLEPQPYPVWIAMDLAWVEACDYLLRLNGHSPGADGEVAYARELGKTIFYDLNALLGALKAEL